MKTIDTRDLLKRKNELEELRDAVTTCILEKADAQEALDAHRAAPRCEEYDEETWDEQTEELEEAVTDAETALESAQLDFGLDEQTELEELETLEDEISDFHHGETMIPEGDFEDYAREYAEELGYMDNKAASSWPFTCIDWEQAAKELAHDYTTVSYQGEDYYVRA